MISRLERRLKFTDYSIENCYIYYEIAKHHLNHMRIDECCAVAKKVIDGEFCPTTYFINELRCGRIWGDKLGTADGSGW